jgi:hypothetical protein
MHSVRRVRKPVLLSIRINPKILILFFNNKQVLLSRRNLVALIILPMELYVHPAIK